jgi:hypothetical protein
MKVRELREKLKSAPDEWELGFDDLSGQLIPVEDIRIEQSHKFQKPETGSKKSLVAFADIKYNAADYTFWGLLNNGVQTSHPVTSLAYLVGLVDSPDAQDLASRPGELSPKAYHPLTPVMLTKSWSPISAVLEKGWKPIVLSRLAKARACASGIWNIKEIGHAAPYKECLTPEQLFWSVLSKVAEQANSRGLLVSIIACPGWSYEHGHALSDLTFDEAKKADRVIWQRIPGSA